jgi:hypothetical protein
VYFIMDKKYTRNPKESDRCPEATAGLNQRTVRCLLDILRTGGPKQETLLLPDTLQLRLQLPPTTPSTTPIYNPDMLLRSTEPTTDYRGTSAYHVYYCYCYYRRYRGRPCLQSQELREVSFQELLILYKNTSFLQPCLRHIIAKKPSIMVLES